jgi:predicted phosphodiesterase
LYPAAEWREAMKLAVLSDIHGNLPALEVVLDDLLSWRPDQVIINGDVINRGPDSLGCLELIEQQIPDSLILKGNHEEFVLECAQKPFIPGNQQHELRRFAHWTIEQLGPRLQHVLDWHEDLDLEDPDGGELHVTHGTRLGKRDGIGHRTPAEKLPAKLGDPKQLFITAHTHLPLVLDYQGTLVVNTGSVGSPFDRDPRAAYGRLAFHAGRWNAEIVRLDYDRARTERDYKESGFLDGGGPLTRLMLTELRQSRGHMAPWMRRYQQAVLDGEITVEKAVREYLDLCS